MLTPEAADVVNRGHDKDVAAVKAAPKSIDFMNDDAPFKTNFSIGDHKGDFQFYGIVDIGYTNVNHSLNPNQALPNSIYPYSYDAAGGHSTTGVSSRNTWINGGLQDSRFGFKGGIDLFHAADNNLKFIYQLEAGFNPLKGELNNAVKSLSQNWTSSSSTAKTYSTFADSSLNGDLFARQAWGGVDAGKLGAVTWGIQYNPFYNIAGDYDPNHKADSFSPLGESGAIGGGGGISENARMKNSLKYANKFDAPMDGKVNIVGMYQFGNDVDTQWGRGYAAQVGYENSLFGIQTAYNNFTDTVKVDVADTSSAAYTPGVYKNAANAPLKAGLYDTQAYIIAAKLTPSKEVKFSGGYQWMQLSNGSDQNLCYGSVFGYSIEGGCASSYYNSSKSVQGSIVASNSNTYSGNGGDHQNIDFWWVGGEYNFGERFPSLAGLTLSAAYYYTDYGTIADSTKTGKSFHINTETAILDYKLNKRFDLYAAATWNQFGGDYVDTVNSTTGAAGMAFKDINAYGVGVRMKF